jgi:hypothetical protein
MFAFLHALLDLFETKHVPVPVPVPVKHVPVKHVTVKHVVRHYNDKTIRDRKQERYEYYKNKYKQDRYEYYKNKYNFDREHKDKFSGFDHARCEKKTKTCDVKDVTPTTVTPTTVTSTTVTPLKI